MEAGELGLSWLGQDWTAGHQGCCLAWAEEGEAGGGAGGVKGWHSTTAKGGAGPASLSALELVNEAVQWVNDSVLAPCSSLRVGRC